MSFPIKDCQEILRKKPKCGWSIIGDVFGECYAFHIKDFIEIGEMHYSYYKRVHVQ